MFLERVTTGLAAVILGTFSCQMNSIG